MFSHLRSQLPPPLDLFQFAFLKNRCIEDAVAIALHNVLQFLDKKMPNYVRMLFIDYSSAFNTISPPKLFDKLIALNIEPALSECVLDFLLGRTQFFKIGPISINTGAPQG